MDKRNPYLHVLIFLICFIALLAITIGLPRYYWNLPVDEANRPARNLFGDTGLNVYAVFMILILDLFGGTIVIMTPLIVIFVIFCQALVSIEIVCGPFLKGNDDKKKIE